MIDPPNVADAPRSHRETEPPVDLVNLPARKVVGQSSATRAIIPYVYMYQSGPARQMMMVKDAAHARLLFKMAQPSAVLADYMLGEDDGLKLALEFQEKARESRIMLMTGGGLTEDELDVCNQRQIPILFKPFLANDVVNLIRNSARRQMAAVATSGSVAQTRKTIDTV
ncbi:MAG: hypothetical protein ACT4OT_09065 [Acidobacteriota bacterium]